MVASSPDATPTSFWCTVDESEPFALCAPRKSPPCGFVCDPWHVENPQLALKTPATTSVLNETFGFCKSTVPPDDEEDELEHELRPRSSALAAAKRTGDERRAIGRRHSFRGA
jgi:hypothetical protein